MKLKWIYLLPLLSVLYSAVNSQVITFNKGLVFLDSLNQETINQIIEVDDGYMICGYSDLYTSKLVISKLNLEGDLVWLKNYGNARLQYRPGYGKSMISTSDSNFAVAVNFIDTLNSPDSRIMIIKFNPYGDTLWSHLVYYPDSADEYCPATGILETYDRGFLVYGDEGGLTSVLVKTDSFGNLEWKTYYGFHSLTNRKYIYCVRQTSDSGYIAGGYQINPGDVKSGDPRIVRFLKDGTRTWDRNVGGPFEDYRRTILQPSGDGNFIVITHYTTGTSGYPHYIPEESKLHIIKISENNEVLSDVMVGDDEEYLYVMDLEVMDDGSFISCGRDIWGDISWLFNFSLDKDSLYFRMVHPLTRSDTLRTLSDIKCCSDGGIISCGDYDTPISGTYVRHPWILKTDRFACLDMGCDTNGIYMIRQPLSMETCKDDIAALSVETYNSADNENYHWQIFQEGLWQDIEDEVIFHGFNNDTMVINPGMISTHSESFRCRIYNEIWSMFSDSIAVTFKDTLAFVAQPQPVSVQYGEQAEFQLIANGHSPVAYQWFHDEVLLEGENDSVLSISNVIESDTGLYFCRMSNECGELESDHVFLRINNLGINDFAGEEPVKISPNPTRGIINISIQGDHREDEIRLIDPSGRPIEFMQNNTGRSGLQLDFSGISQGIYYLIIELNGEPHIRRIVKY